MTDPVPHAARSEKPVPSQGTDLFGSDAIAQAVREADIPYVALNPGASFRGLHDSLVNYLGNEHPQMLLVLHEEAAVAIAHGYTKASGRMMGAILHSNVGLMHGSMAIFNAWCDRIPMLILGATGPVDAARRRPWIDWIHTAADQGALIRHFIKWDDQPASPGAGVEAVLRAAQISRTAPYGPTYVNLDAGMQESRIDRLPTRSAAARYRAPDPVHPAPALVAEAARLLSSAERPVILVGRSGRSEEAWRNRVALAEKLDAPVICDLKTGATFPTRHPLLVEAPNYYPGAEGQAVLRRADVILSLDWIDLEGTLRQTLGDGPVDAKIVQVSLDQHLHNGANMEYFGLAPADHYLFCEPDIAVPLLYEAVETCTPRDHAFAPMVASSGAATPADAPMIVESIAEALEETVGDRDVCLVRLPIGWNGRYRHFEHPLDFLGADGGGGIGSGPGMTAGAALALRGSGRTAIGILGDGDFMMGCTAIWTAVRYEIPMLVIVANNRSFYNDEAHQERVAIQRGRPVENKWIGQAIGGPDIDIAGIATAQGATGIGPVKRRAALADAIRQGLACVDRGGVAVIDARVEPGYGSDVSGNGIAEQERS